MAKNSLIQKNKKIFKKKKSYKKVIIFKKKVKKYSFFIFFKLVKMQKNKNMNKFVKRCYITGRNRSVYKFFFLNRNLIRKIGSFGYIVGIKKSSW